MENKENLPVGFLRLLKWFCPDHLFEEIEGDLLQRLRKDEIRFGTRMATLRLGWNAIRFFRPGILLRYPRGESRISNLFLRLRGSLSISGIGFSTMNNLAGWTVFAVALFTYLVTMEETASYWDCGEFIAASYKLQVPHPPGAPLFLLLGRLFSLFAGGDAAKVPVALNTMSALASAFTVLFLFWSIVLVGRKMMAGASDRSMPGEKSFLLMAAAAVGSLAYAFSDSFWFSAVEAEVYAMSSFFTAFVVWGILKWDVMDDPRRANRWLLLVAYIIGLSIGVHLLNLLTLPALALIYYFKRFKSTTWGVVATLCISGGIVLVINDFLVPGLPTIAGNFEVFFVNTLGLFFGSGALFFSLLVTGSLAWGVYFTQKRNHSLGNTVLLASAFILIGYGSYSLVLIRSNYDTPINENAPKDVMSFVRYLKREQYGTRPLLYGAYFTARPIDYKYGEVTYVKGKERYEVTDRKFSYVYEPGEETILPRAWDPEQKEAYESILNLREGQRPTFGQNLYFMFRHQLGAMYMRYFMWNFAGRESDIQGADWLRPMEWFKKIPEALSTNKGRNNLFMIPFFLGLVGMFFQFLKDTKTFAVIALLFAMLGMAIVFYLNSPPVEPRERDYIYVGSYYAFSFWIGVAVIAMAETSGRLLRNATTRAIAAAAIGFVAPAVMISAGWNDHDRSDRFFSVDAATNALKSCDPDGIIFTGGDNDTFPLWYAQESEGCRTDLRVLVLSYCNTDWYLDQTTRRAYLSEPFQYTLGSKEYRQGGPNDYLPFVNARIPSIDATEYLNLLAKGYAPLRSGDRNLLPSRVVTVDIDKKAIIAKGIIPKTMEALVVDQMQFKLIGNTLEKKDLAFLDLLVTTNWARPIYLNTTSVSQMKLDVTPYIVQEGNAFRILPVRNPNQDRPFLVDTRKTYDRMMHDFQFRGLDDPDVYYNDDYKMQVFMHRANFNSLAQALLDEGNQKLASRALLFSLEKMPDQGVPYDATSPDTVSLLFRAGQRRRAIEMANVVGNRADEMATYLVAEGNHSSMELRQNLFMLGSLQQSLYENGEGVLARKFEEAYSKLLSDMEHAPAERRSQF